MEELVNILKEKMENFKLDGKNNENVADKFCYMSAFLKGLTEFFNNTKITTRQENENLIQILNFDLIQKLIEGKIIPKNSLGISLEAISQVVKQLLQRKISQNKTQDIAQIQKYLNILIRKLFVEFVNEREKIASKFIKTIKNGSNILIYGYSLEIIYSLYYAKKAGKSFMVYVAENEKNEKIEEVLKKYDINYKFINVNSIVYYISKIDIILTGADAVCESGGIINKIGTSVVALCAKDYGKPFYVMTNSLKYLKMHILKQNDLIQFNQIYSSTGEPIVDYTRPEFITLFFTDKEIYLPNAIVDEIIQLFDNIK